LPPGQILRIKLPEFDFGNGFAPDPAGGAYSASHAPQLDLRGHASRGIETREKRMEWN